MSDKNKKWLAIFAGCFVVGSGIGFIYEKRRLNKELKEAMEDLEEKITDGKFWAMILRDLAED